jgi:DNA repair protein RadC
LAHGFDDDAAAAGQPHYHGHRERLRERFRNGGAEAVTDYELLELVLFRAIPRRDVKPLCKALIGEFGSFAGVITAPENRLKEVAGLGDAAITEFRIVQAAGQKLVKETTVEGRVLGSWSAVLAHCRSMLAHSTHEEFWVIFLDKKNRLIKSERQQRGTVDHTPVYVREVMKRALELSSTAIILVHNHPSGDPTPSRADIDMTKQIADLAKGLGITVHDHIVIGRDGHASFKGSGLI